MLPTRNLSIRLDTKGDAALRKALQGLGKDGQKALRLIEQGGPKASRGLRAVDRASRSLQGSLTGVAARAGPLGVALGSLGPAGLAAAAGLGALLLGARALFRAAPEAIDFADNIVKVADAVGLSTDALQEFRFAADLAGVSSEGLDKALKFFAKTVGELKTRVSSELGLALKDFDKQLLKNIRNSKNQEEAFTLVVRALEKETDATKRAALAKATLGRAGIDLVNIGNAEAGAFERGREEARAFGAVLDGPLLRATVDSKDELTRLQRQIEANSTRILLNLSPALISITGLFADFTAGIVAAGDALGDAFTPGAQQQLASIEARIAALRAAAAAPPVPAGQLFASSARGMGGRRGSIRGALSGPGNPQRRPGTGGGGSELTILERQAAALREVIALQEEASAQIVTVTGTPEPRPETEARAEANLARFIEGLRSENELMRVSGLELERLTLARQEELALRQATNIARQAGRELGEDEIRQIKEQVADTLAMKKAREDLAKIVKIEIKETRDKQALQREAKSLLAGVATETERLAVLEERLTELVAAEVIALEDKNRILARTEEAMRRVSEQNRDLSEGLRGVARDLRQGASAFEVFERAANRAIDSILDRAIDSLLDGGGSGGLGFLDRLFGSLSGAGSSGGFDAAASFFDFGKGGIMTERGPLPLRHYSAGGIARTAQVAVFGEGAVPEAFVPVPSGRIPVEFRGGGKAFAGGTVVQIIDQRGQGSARPQVSRGRGTDGREIIRIFIRDEVNAGIGRGDFDRSFGTRFGASPGLAVR